MLNAMLLTDIATKVRILDDGINVARVLVLLKQSVISSLLGGSLVSFLRNRDHTEQESWKERTLDSDRQIDIN